MKSRSVKWLLPCLSMTFMTIFLFVVTGTSAFAHGKKTHQPEGTKSEHMQSMLDLKKSIPEEYRIMERTPIIPSEESLGEGRKLFLQNCSVCHGEKGDGKGLAAAALKIPPANFLDKKHSDIYGPGEKSWLIGNGSGETGMPAFSQITPLQRWHLVNYIVSLPEENSAGK